MRILYVTTIGLTMTFFKDLIRELIKSGNTVDIATNENEYPVDSVYREMGCHITQIGFSRSPFAKDNIRAYKELKALISENKYDIVHCHTPVAGVITRLACRKARKDGLLVFYTAHGFHFYHGAPRQNWMVFYPIEKYCSRFTDVLITINQEDYERAKKKMKAKQVEYVPGVGIDIDKYANTVVDRAAKRRELGIPEDAFLLISVGELNENKNHQVVIRALAEAKNENIHYMIAGEGYLRETLLDLVHSLGLDKQVHLLGFRNDVVELYKTADADVFPSIREGLGLAAVEGMAAGIPLICADNRGTREFAVNNENALVCCCDSTTDFVSAILKTINSGEEIRELIENGEKTVKRFAADTIIAQIQSLYAGSTQ